MSRNGDFARRLPFYYGWAVLAAVCCAGVARQGPAVATLSMFVTPMTESFGWSRAELSGAVSLAGLLAALATPLLGPLLDRFGARPMLAGAVLLTAAATFGLSFAGSLALFYLFYCAARLSFAGPFDLGIYGAVNAWFLRRRALAAGIANLAQMLGLAAMPLIAHWAIADGGWRHGWVVVSASVLAMGLLPVLLVVRRRPEDLGLAPDGAPARSNAAASTDATAGSRAVARGGPGAAVSGEPDYSRREALATPAFWLLALYSALVFPVQAGVSLHQAPHLLERGLDAGTAALVVGSFSLASAAASLLVGLAGRRLPLRLALALSAGALTASTVAMLAVTNPLTGFVAAVLFGLGIGGALTLLPVAWADYFGRRSYGAIRGIALSIQVLAQAAGPLLSGLLRDASGSYSPSLWLFTLLSLGALGAAVLARPPRPRGLNRAGSGA